VKIWHAATGQEVLTLKGHAQEVTSVCFGRDGKRLASASAHVTVIRRYNIIKLVKNPIQGLPSRSIRPPQQKVSRTAKWPPT
jgi:WD40 repeat protein